MAACVYNVALFIGAKLFYSSINRYDAHLQSLDDLTSVSRKRSRIWDSMTQEERQEYLATTRDKGNKR
jgi:hypothetical protein